MEFRCDQGGTCYDLCNHFILLQIALYLAQCNALSALSSAYVSGIKQRQTSSKWLYNHCWLTLAFFYSLLDDDYIRSKVVKYCLGFDQSP